MSHLSVSVSFTADDVRIAHEGDEHPTCHQIEICPKIGANVSLFGDGSNTEGTFDIASTRALREALAKAVALLDDRLLLLEGAEAEAVPA